MEHAASRRHSARSNDDRRVARGLEVFRFLHGRDGRHAGRAKRAEASFGRRRLRVELVGALGVKRQTSCRHRTVDVHRQHRNPLFLFEPFQPVEDFLNASDGEGRNDQLASPSDGRVHDPGEPRATVVFFVYAIAVGRFDEQNVRGLDWRGIGQHGSAVSSEVSTEEDGLSLHREAHVGRAQQMAGVDELCFDAGDDRHRPAVPARLQLHQRPFRVVHRVERQRGVVFRVAMAVGQLCVLFLDVRGIWQDQRAEVAGSGRAEDPPAKSLRDQTRQIPAVIEMCVSEDHGVD